MKLHRSVLLLPLLCATPAVAEFENNAHSAIDLLQKKWYNAETGLWNNLWWQSGNMLTAVAKFGSHDAAFKQHAANIVGNTYNKAANQRGAKNWLNDFYDDEGWWALGWIASYDLTGDRKYLDTAKNIFEDMTGGWTTPCNGGIWWDKPKTSIAAISNELFISVAAHLANRVHDSEKKEYRDWAESAWSWFSKSGVINSDNVINDGLDQGTCKNDGKTVFTYNQGVILGGLAELAKATGNGHFTDEAKKIVQGAMRKLTEGGILTEKSNALDEQGAQFKGVFVRGLAALNRQAPDNSYADFLKKNAESALKKAENNEGVIGTKWQGGGETSVTSHASGVDLLVAASEAN